MNQANATAMAKALSRLRAGESATDALLDQLNCWDDLILSTILQGLADPASLDWLCSAPDQDPTG
ncbi:hypothetical protein ACH518_01525 [Methylomonas sp. HW2-6]|uniref:hypothetical protein n=1 Tax=Methylomonas sp. HW2-6 TaxID=3376687 RepID=UPI004041B429